MEQTVYGGLAGTLPCRGVYMSCRARSQKSLQIRSRTKWYSERASRAADLLRWAKSMLPKLSALALALLLSGCVSVDNGSLASTQKCLLFESHEKDGKERVALQFEALDGQRLGGYFPTGGFYKDGYAYKVDAGDKQVMIRVYTRGLEGRHNFHVRLESGHTYRVAGEYGEGYGKFFVRDSVTGARLTEAVALQFSAVSRGGMIPIIIPTK